MKIQINSLSFSAIIGILEQERQQPQNIQLDLTLEYDFETGQYIDYVAIKDFLMVTIIEKKYLLLEDAILDLKKKLSNQYPQILAIEIKITKTELFPNCVISVSE